MKKEYSLKPCPFCGRIPEIQITDVGPGKGREAWISCKGPYCIEQKHVYATKKAAVDAWNRRADD